MGLPVGKAALTIPEGTILTVLAVLAILTVLTVLATLPRLAASTSLPALTSLRYLSDGRTDAPNAEDSTKEEGRSRSDCGGRKFSPRLFDTIALRSLVVAHGERRFSMMKHHFPSSWMRR
jgi:hypothetical protein